LLNFRSKQERFSVGVPGHVKGKCAVWGEKAVKDVRQRVLRHVLGTIRLHYPPHLINRTYPRLTCIKYLTILQTCFWQGSQ